ncbi:endo alpha-1,4 polygalactosaminidase [Domibacillus iocasae]|uniref:endo alpha-1,4 polygalactosaminidase n=1 Tax=Domibacillus iocasae TaxID=1714016 RepID=UPI00114D045F|nr:endo alpha-1,4 polygalactosaminidase [Domibacillus iocasae]
MVNNRMNDVHSFKIYYGAATEEAVEELIGYDMVVIEPAAFTKEQVAELQNKGTRVLGYVSVMELEVWHEDLVQPSDFLLKNNEKWHIPKWESYMMDITKAHYRNVVLSKVASHVHKKGMDGVFFDTAGNIDDYFYENEKLQKKLREGYTALLAQVQQSYPGLYVMQNWGFDTVKAASLPYIDGVLWEDFDKEMVRQDKWSQSWIAYFRSKSHQLDTFTVTNNKSSNDYSHSLGFLSTNNKDDIYDDL